MDATICKTCSPISYRDTCHTFMLSLWICAGSILLHFFFKYAAFSEEKHCNLWIVLLYKTLHFRELCQRAAHAVEEKRHTCAVFSRATAVRLRGSFSPKHYVHAHVLLHSGMDSAMQSQCMCCKGHRNTLHTIAARINKSKTVTTDCTNGSSRVNCIRLSSPPLIRTADCQPCIKHSGRVRDRLAGCDHT